MVYTYIVRFHRHHNSQPIGNQESNYQTNQYDIRKNDLECGTVIFKVDSASKCSQKVKIKKLENGFYFLPVGWHI
jgi:hypothetical protein